MNPLEADLKHVFQHTRPLWDELRLARIFLTGGTGFFGCWLLETFLYANEQLELGASVTVLTRNASAFARKAPHLATGAGIELVEGSIATFPFPEKPHSHIIHGAVDYTDSPGLFASIVDGTRRTLEYARASGARRYLLASSGAVYGLQPPEISHIPETYQGAPDPLSPRSAYGEGKRAAEHLCAVYHETYGVAATIARGFAFIGPYLRLDSNAAAGNFIGDVLHGRPITITGDGTPYRSYLYAADLAIWLWTILCRGTAGRAYNVGSDAAVTIKELAETVVEVLAPQTPVRVMGQSRPGQAAERYVPSIERARTELGLESWIGLKEGVRRTAAWWAERHNESF